MEPETDSIFGNDGFDLTLTDENCPSFLVNEDDPLIL